MNTPTRPLAAALLLTALLLPCARAQRPQTRPAEAEKPWPRVGFQEFLDAGKFIPSVDHSHGERGEAGDCILDMRGAGDGTGRIFLLTRAGRIYILKDGKVLPDPFLDMSDKMPPRVASDGERGLLTFAFPPNYKDKNCFYIYYTNREHNLVLERYKVNPKIPDSAIPDSGEQLLLVHHEQFPNHNGGQLQFGRDGMLYLSIGDGGSGYDPFLSAQNLGMDLGKVLRLDVEGKPDEGKAYRVPPDNPFVKTPGALPEIWALGLRNPWRFSFDPENGDMFIGNVGQNDYEQIYHAPGSSKGGENYGWSIYEGTHDIADMSNPNHRANLARNASQPRGTSYGITFPVAEFSHYTPPIFDSITGGYVYRGKEFPSWNGTYFFSDWGNSPNGRLDLGQIWALRYQDGKWETRQVDDDKSPLKKCAAFGIDDNGNLYALSWTDGKIYKLVERPADSK